MCVVDERDGIDNIITKCYTIFLERRVRMSWPFLGKLLTLNLEISSSTSYFNRSPYLALYPLARFRSFSLKSISLKISEIRTPLRVALVEYAG